MRRNNSTIKDLIRKPDSTKPGICFSYSDIGPTPFTVLAARKLRRLHILELV
jgi:hypothetical protein